MTFDLTKLSKLQSVSLSSTWIDEQEDRADNVLKYRAYFDGDHDAAYLTSEMRNLLRITDTTDIPFAANYCSVVTTTMVDRLDVTGITAETDALNEWIALLLKANRFDGLQHNVHESAINDGDTYVMVSYDNAKQRVVLTHEYAYDGTSGVIVLYRSRDMRDMAAAFKIWEIDLDAERVQTRVNVYFPDRIERYAAINDGDLVPFNAPGLPAKERWASQRGNDPVGIPLVHFKNRGRYNYGQSEIAPAIPIQDAHNRTWYSLVLNSEYTGFPLLFALGFDPGGDLRPGSLVKAMQGADPPGTDVQVDFRRIEAGSNQEFLTTAQYQEGVIGRITRTPSPEFVAPTASGEARKQAEAGLVGKAKRAQVVFGNAWEDVIGLAWRVQDAYGQERPPTPYEDVACQWRSAELRNDKEVIENAVALQPFVDERTFLEMVAPVANWTSDKIDQIIEAKAVEKETDMSGALAQMPNFGRFDDRFEDAGSGMEDEMPMMEAEADDEQR